MIDNKERKERGVKERMREMETKWEMREREMRKNIIVRGVKGKRKSERKDGYFA